MAWLAGLGVDKDSVRRGWNRLKHQIGAFSKEQQDVLLATSGDSQLVVEGSCHAALMFGSLAPNVAKSDVMVLAESLLRLTSPDGDTEAMAAPVPCRTNWGFGRSTVAARIRACARTPGQPRRMRGR